MLHGQANEETFGKNSKSVCFFSVSQMLSRLRNPRKICQRHKICVLKAKNAFKNNYLRLGRVSVSSTMFSRLRWSLNSFTLVCVWFNATSLLEITRAFGK